MSAEDLTLAFHALLGQFQGEQIYIDDINECLNSHANDLDGFRGVSAAVEGKLQTLDEKQNEHEAAMNLKMQDLYAMIQQWATEAIAYMRNGVVEDQIELYHKISAERATYVSEN